MCPVDIRRMARGRGRELGPVKQLGKWVIGALFAAYILVPVSINLMRSFGAWWGALIPPLLVALVLAFWWAVDHVGR